MVAPLNWKTVEVRLGDLIPNEKNPKSSDEATVARLNDSIDALGQFETLAVDSDGVSALDGHQRLSSWIAAKGEDFKVEARQASRPVTDEERRKIILYSGKGTHGQWDFEMLNENFEQDELQDWGGFSNIELGIWPDDVDNPADNQEPDNNVKNSVIKVSCLAADSVAVSEAIAAALAELDVWAEIE